MVKFVIKIILVAASLLIASHFVSGFDIDQFWPTAIMAALMLGVLNSIIRPVLKLLTFPITVLTLGLFSLILNVILFWLLAFLPGVTISGFFAALFALLIVSVVGWIIDLMLK
jgi:putative membrane protein